MDYSQIAKSLQGQLDTFGKKYLNRRSSRSGRPDKSGDIVPSGYRKGQLSQFTPEQTELFQNLFQHVSPDSYLSRLASGDESLYSEMEAPALRQFNELQGNLASRFSGMGMGSRNSSGFQNSSNQAASNFAQDLQSRRQDLQRQAILDLQGLSRELLGQRPYEKFLAKKSYPTQQPDQSGDIWGGLLSGVAGAGAGYLTGNIPGAVAGGATGFYKGYTGGL